MKLCPCFNIFMQFVKTLAGSDNCACLSVTISHPPSLYLPLALPLSPSLCFTSFNALLVPFCLNSMSTSPHSFLLFAPFAYHQASVEGFSHLIALDPDAMWLLLTQIYSPWCLHPPGPKFVPVKVRWRFTLMRARPSLTDSVHSAADSGTMSIELCHTAAVSGTMKLVFHIFSRSKFSMDTDTGGMAYVYRPCAAVGVGMDLTR